jgi:hypothetical protein
MLAYFGRPLQFAAHFMAEHKDRDKHSIMLEGKKYSLKLSWIF